MSFDWTTKEKIVLLSDILEFGDQSESWSAISNDLTRTFQTNIILPSQTKREGRYSIKNCKQEYKQLVDRYKSEWSQHGSSNGLKLPLAKYIWLQLKSIYQAELTYQLNESRKKLTEFCLRLETAVNIKSNTIEPTPPPSATEIITSTLTSQDNEQQVPTIDAISQSIKPSSDILPSEPTQFTLTSENNTNSSIFDSSKEQITIPDQGPYIEIPHETNRQSSPIISPNLKQHDQDISQQTLIDSSSLNIPSDQHSSISQPIPSINPTATTISDSASSSRSTSRTSSETKTDIIKIIPTTTPKYHVYFSPKNSINNNFTTNKIKSKRKAIEDIKDETESESHETPSSSTEPSKVSTTAPMTRRSINTRSVPNTAVEQEEEKSRRFSAMISENPNSWQSQSMAIIQFILSHKQGYLFEHEITDEIAPKYHKYIRHPIALDTIRKNLESNVYQTKEYFKRDIYLMLYNAMKYNPRHHHVHRSAKHIFNIILKLFTLSAQDIYGQIPIKLNTTTTTPTTPVSNENPLIKRQRIK